MTGDFVAAVILLEFLYLAMKQRSLRVLFASESVSLSEMTKCQFYDAGISLKDAELMMLTPVPMGASTISSEKVIIQKSFLESLSDLVSRLACVYASNSEAVLVLASVGSMVVCTTGMALGAIDGRMLAYAGIIFSVVRYIVNLCRLGIPAASAKREIPIIV